MARGSKQYDASDLPQADKADGCPHPREVYSLVGHAHAERDIATLIGSNQLHHAWLISGPSGIGKATLAYRMIRTVLGGVSATQGLLDVASTDPMAQRIQSMGHGDFLLIRRPYDVKTKKLKAEIPVNETRKISNFFSKKASEGGWRVCLIDSADELNRNAANAVLKTLEEPPEKALIILLSSAPGQLLPTIRSRCMNMALRAVPTADLAKWLSQNISASDADIEASILLAKGAPGKAFALVQNADKVLRPLANLLKSFPKANPNLIHQISDSLSTPQTNMQYNLFWDCLQDIMYDQAIYAATGEWNGAYTPIALERSAEVWMNLHDQFKEMRSVQAGLNMNKKTVLLRALSAIAA